MGGYLLFINLAYFDSFWVVLQLFKAMYKKSFALGLMVYLKFSMVEAPKNPIGVAIAHV